MLISRMNALTTALNIFIFIARFALPVLILLLLLSTVKRLFRKSPQYPIAQLGIIGTQSEYDINAYECSIGRSKICDIRLNLQSVSRRHAVLSYDENYGFKIISVNDAKIFVNGIKVDGFAYISEDDVIEIGGVQLKLLPPIYSDVSSGRRPSVKKGCGFSMLLLSVIQLVVMFELMIHYGTELPGSIPVTFAVLLAVEWVYYLIFRKSDNFGIEIIGFLLTTFGFAVAASAYPSSLTKQLISFLMGFAAFIVSRFLLKNLELSVKLRYAFAIGTVVLFAINLIFGKNINGAKNWIVMGPITFQPSELLKYAFVFVGASTLDRLLAKRNVIMFLGFSGICLLSLAIMRDFGTAAIYFVTTLIIMFMRSGDLKIITGVTAGVGVAGIAVANFVPYVKRRFATYRHAWDFPADKGYQQTRTMIAIASGGLFGLGGGNGNLDKVSAADTDLVFGLVCEEWGLLIALMLVLCFVLFAVYSWSRTSAANSAFYAIAACAVSGLFIFQISLNIFGSTDLLPLTGVTMPFVSNGGSSMIASWALLSFIKAVGENSNKPRLPENAQVYDDYYDSGYEDEGDYYDDGYDNGYDENYDEGYDSDYEYEDIYSNRRDG